MPLTEEDQERRRQFFRRHWEEGVAFNAHCGIRVERWDPDGVELALPYADRLSAHDGVFHGGVLCALIDTTGCAAVMAGHDFNAGSRITTVSLAVQYFTTDPGQGAVASGHCVRRGGRIQHSEVVVRSTGGKALAQGLVTTHVAGERPGLADALAT